MLSFISFPLSNTEFNERPTKLACGPGGLRPVTVLRALSKCGATERDSICLRLGDL